MRSVTILTAVLALSLGILASPVLAGGWAVTTMDDVPDQFVSGKDYVLGYTIRQHGQTPICGGHSVRCYSIARRPREALTPVGPERACVRGWNRAGGTPTG